MRIDPHCLIGQPLVSKATAPGDYAVTVAGKTVGRIMRQPRSFGRETWFWTITGPVLIKAGLSSNGEADSLHEARQAFRATFDKWLAWALQYEGAVNWMG